MRLIGSAGRARPALASPPSPTEGRLGWSAAQVCFLPTHPPTRLPHRPHLPLQAPYVLMNLFRKIGGGGKKKKKNGGMRAADEQLEPHEAPRAVPLPGGNGGHASYAVV